MKSVAVAEFTRHFRRLRKQTCHVKDRGKVVGTWNPVPETAKPVDVIARVKKNFSKPVPFTGADLLKESRR